MTTETFLDSQKKVALLPDLLFSQNELSHWLPRSIPITLVQPTETIFPHSTEDPGSKSRIPNPTTMQSAAYSITAQIPPPF